MTNVDEKSYKKYQGTNWASYRTEVAVAMAAHEVARERDLNSNRVCRVINTIVLAGGASNVPRDLEFENMTIGQLRDILFDNDLAIPDCLGSFNPSHIQRKILSGTRK